MVVAQVGVGQAVVVQMELKIVLKTAVDGHRPVVGMPELHIVIQTDEEGGVRVSQLGGVSHPRFGLKFEVGG